MYMLITLSQNQLRTLETMTETTFTTHTGLINRVVPRICGSCGIYEWTRR